MFVGKLDMQQYFYSYAVLAIYFVAFVRNVTHKPLVFN